MLAPPHPLWVLPGISKQMGVKLTKLVLNRSQLLTGPKSGPASWGLYFAEGTENQNLIFAFKANNYAAIMLINATACTQRNPCIARV